MSTFANFAENQTNSLRVGAGRSEIELNAALFPTEGFIAVHDPLHARVLVLEGDNKIVLVSIELTSVTDEVVVELQKIVSQMVGMPPDNVYICVTHTFSAPHFMPQQLCRTKEDQKKNELLFKAVKTAVTMSLTHAIAAMMDARVGYESGYCNVNVNRDVYTEDGWWLGNNETGPSEKSVPVVRFESLEGELIALLFSYSVQPSVMDSPQSGGNRRMVTADLAGAASSFLEKEYGGNVTALFCLGAAADQAPSLKGAKLQYIGKDGHIHVETIDAEGYIIAEMLGKRLGIEVLQISEKIKCQPLPGSIFTVKDSVKLPGQKIADFNSLKPMKQYTYIPAEEREETLNLIRIGNIAILGVRPELDCMTAVNVKEQSPFRQTMVLTMVNSGAKYMPERSAYDRITYEAMNSPFAQGSAELLSEKLLEMLRG